jgi:uncharacterized membrane protein
MATEETLKRKRDWRWPLIAIGCITLAGLALRLTNIGESLWLDELHTGWVVKEAWSDVAWRAQIGNQSPLWFYAVKLITTLGGESELTLRLLSLIAGTALIPATYWLVYLLMPRGSSGSPLASGLAAALIAVDPNCIFYATEARPYACLQLCAAVQLGLFLQILAAPTTKLRIGWILLTALAFHLHYTGILILLGELVVLLGYYSLSRQPVPYRPWRAAFDWQIAVMLCLPAIGHLLEVAQRRGMWDSMSGRPEWSELLTVFPLYPVTALGLAIYPAFVLAGIVAVLTVGQRFRGWAAANPQASWAALLLVAIWLVVPLLAAFAVAHFNVARIFLRRYLIAFAIGPPLLTALLTSRLPRCWLQGIVIAAVLCLAIQQSGIILQLRYDGRAVGDRNEDWRSAFVWLRKEYDLSGGEIRCRPGLIEEDWFVGLPSEDPRVRAYLDFPLDSLYACPEVKPSPDAIEWIVSRGKGGDQGIGSRAFLDRLEQRAFGDVRVTKWALARAHESVQRRSTPPSPQSQFSDP